VMSVTVKSMRSARKMSPPFDWRTDKYSRKKREYAAAEKSNFAGGISTVTVARAVATVAVGG